MNNNQMKLVPVEPTEEMLRIAAEDFHPKFPETHIGTFGRAWQLMLSAAPAVTDEPSAWLIPRKIDLSKSRSVHFYRTPEGKDKTDAELKDQMDGSVVYGVELFSDHSASDYVEDKHGNKHYYKPLYEAPQPSPSQHDVKRLMEYAKEYIGWTDSLSMSEEGYAAQDKLNSLISEIEGRK